MERHESVALHRHTKPVDLNMLLEKSNYPGLMKITEHCSVSETLKKDTGPATQYMLFCLVLFWSLTLSRILLFFLSSRNSGVKPSFMVMLGTGDHINGQMCTFCYHVLI